MHVAMLTVEIRNLIPHVITVRKDKKSKSVLVEKIQMRKKILKFLRREDYQRFLWLLRELRIRYVLPPDYYKHESKRFKRKQEVFKAADELRKKKIAELREQLESEREEFMQYKAETLKQIEDDMAKYNLDKEQFAAKLRRKREGKTYPHIYTWEERQQMAQELAMK
nr:hypothetical protein BaRGS_004874 [Batillaria attramentaria]